MDRAGEAIMSVLYYDCFAGMSSDMHLAALLNLGVDYDELMIELARLGVSGYGIQASRATRQGITGVQVRVVIDPKQPCHHDLRQIEAMIGASALKDTVRSRAIAVFRRLAEAEARIQDTSPDRADLYDLGSLDALVSIVAGSIALDRLNVDQIWCSPVELGGGVTHGRHGLLPAPTPTTLELLKGMPIKLGGVPFEATTPTGAALLAALVDEFVMRPQIVVDRVGYGIDPRDGSFPNVLRVCLGELPMASGAYGEQCVLECTIDDMNPECYDHVLERLWAAEATDIWLTPVLMNKNRPGTVLSVLCAPVLALALTERLLTETTALAVRRYSVTYTALARETIQVATRYGEVTVKIAQHRGRSLRGKAEYEDCKRLALERGVSIHAVYAAVREALVVWELPAESVEIDSLPQ